MKVAEDARDAQHPTGLVRLDLPGAPVLYLMYDAHGELLAESRVRADLANAETESAMWEWIARIDGAVLDHPRPQTLELLP